jgi:peroxiredoxin
MTGTARSLKRHATMTFVVAGLALASAVQAGGNDHRALAGYRLAALDGGESTTLSAYHGDVVVVNFWASWCAPCRGELRELNQWHEAWKQRGGRVVAISVDKDIRKARRMAADESLTMTVLHDGPDGLAAQLDLPALPCTWLLGRDGRVVRVIAGSAPADLKALRAEAERLMKHPAAPTQRAGMNAPQGVEQDSE